MEDLHDALKTLRPLDWDDLPRDDLANYTTEAFEAAELIINSVPQMPDKGTAFHDSQPHFDRPNAADDSSDIVASQARAPAPHSSHEEQQKQWGKPLKVNSKENPLHVSLYKMAGHDRRGAWFARRSVHEGISFGKFKAAMLREFPESLLVEGPPGAGAKRGLGAERRVEQIDLENGKGRMEVYQLSAQMPSPVSPREFLTLITSSDDVLSEKSAAELQDGSKHVPRHFVLISRPTSHDDLPPRSNFVRGQYESVEIIREIPLHKSQSTLDLSKTESDPEINPVEWIMITRSDPGGGIPRFMVERGTPSAMLGDLTKFLDWACAQDEIKDRDEDLEKQQTASDDKTGDQAQEGSSRPETTKDAAERPATAPAAVATAQTQSKAETQPQEESGPAVAGGGMMSNVAAAVEAGLSAYAPVSVSNYIHDHLHPDAQDDSDSDTSDDDSYLSAEDLRRLSTAPEHTEPTNLSAENVSLASGISTPDLVAPASDKKNLNRHDKELRKLTLKREKLEQDLAKKREQEEAKLVASQEKDQSAEEKARESMDRELEKANEKHAREMEKLEAKRVKAAQKAEEKRRKKEDSSRLSMVAHERDDLREQVDLFRRENTLLQAQVETLQRENTALASRLGKLGGPEVLKAVQDEVGGSRNRTSTMKSGESGRSVMSSSTSTKSG